MPTEERVVIFIDGSNFYHGLKTSHKKTKVDFGKIAHKLANGRKLVRTYYYNVPVDQNEDPIRYKEQQKIFSYLDKIQYFETTLGRLVRRERAAICSNCKASERIVSHNEKGIDVSIAVDMLTMGFKNIYDTAILVSGDGDFEKAIKGVKDLGKHVENAYVNMGHSKQLMRVCDKFVDLDAAFLKDCWLS
ncbi:MAG: NYN domain-containing protein [Deltaproteobacteria bacterium]|nr:NYN domain-containing protein [Deltaproteobacteria bacterium]